MSKGDIEEVKEKIEEIIEWRESEVEKIVALIKEREEQTARDIYEDVMPKNSVATAITCLEIAIGEHKSSIIKYATPEEIEEGIKVLEKLEKEYSKKFKRV